MKRSRIFLGVTTALLAIAGIAAAKVHRSPLAKDWWGTKVVAGNVLCTKAYFTHCILGNASLHDCKYPTAIQGTLFQLYTRGKEDGTVICNPSFVAKYNNQ